MNALNSGDGVSGDHVGIWVDWYANIKSATGNVTLNADGGTYGIDNLGDFALGDVGYSGNYVVGTDNIRDNGNFTVRTTGDITLRPYSVNGTLGLNGADGRLPWAALQAGSTEGAWAFVSPCHWQIGALHIAMHHAMRWPSR